MGQGTTVTPSEIFRTELRGVRTRHGLTQERLTELVAQQGIDLHPTAITKIEKGQRNVSLDEAVAIATALGFYLDDQFESLTLLGIVKAEAAPAGVPELLTIREAAALLRLGSDTTYELARTNSIPSVKLGRSIRVPRAALLAYLERQIQ